MLECQFLQPVGHLEKSSCCCSVSSGKLQLPPSPLRPCQSLLLLPVSARRWRRRPLDWTVATPCWPRRRPSAVARQPEAFFSTVILCFGRLVPSKDKDRFTTVGEGRLVRTLDKSSVSRNLKIKPTGGSRSSNYDPAEARSGPRWSPSVFDVACAIIVVLGQPLALARAPDAVLCLTSWSPGFFPIFPSPPPPLGSP